MKGYDGPVCSQPIQFGQYQKSPWWKLTAVDKLEFGFDGLRRQLELYHNKKVPAHIKVERAQLKAPRKQKRKSLQAAKQASKRAAVEESEQEDDAEKEAEEEAANADDGDGNDDAEPDATKKAPKTRKGR